MGATLCRELLSQYGLQCICLSGDIARSDLDPEPGSPFIAYLAKPVDMTVMEEAIRKAAMGYPLHVSAQLLPTFPHELAGV